jgi:hypothetical protein
LSIEELLSLFDHINFTNPDSSDYIPPQRVKLDGAPSTVEKLKGGIQLLIDRIKNQSPYTAVPSNEEERKKWYQQLEYVLKKVIELSKEKESSDKMLVSMELMRLGAAGNNCGSRWLREGQDIIQSLLGNWDQAIANQGINGKIDFWLDTYKTGIVQQLTLDFTSQMGRAMQPHIFHYVGKVMMDQGIALSNDMMIDTHDAFLSEVEQRIGKQTVINQINSYFLPLPFAHFIKGKIEEELMVNPNFSESIVNTMRGYGETQISQEFQVLDNSLEEKKLEYGIKKTQELLANAQAQNAMLNNDTALIAQLEKANPHLKVANMQFKQQLKTFSNEQKQQLLIENNKNIQQHKNWLNNQNQFSAQLKDMGTVRATQELRSAKDEKIDAWLSDKRLLTMDPTSNIPKIS